MFDSPDKFSLCNCSWDSSSWFVWFAYEKLFVTISRRHLIFRCSCAGDLELDCHPFPHCIIRNFLDSETFVENLQTELLGLNFNEKSNDLYKFKQVVHQIHLLTDLFQLRCCLIIFFALSLFPCSQMTWRREKSPILQD